MPPRDPHHSPVTGLIYYLSVSYDAFEYDVLVKGYPSWYVLVGSYCEYMELKNMLLLICPFFVIFVYMVSSVPTFSTLGPLVYTFGGTVITGIVQVSHCEFIAKFSFFCKH